MNIALPYLSGISVELGKLVKILLTNTDLEACSRHQAGKVNVLNLYLLKVMVAIETESIDNAITAGLPSTVAGVPSHYVSTQVPATDDEQLSTTSFLNNLAQQQVKNVLNL